MILTHFLAFMAGPAVALAPDAAVLPLASSAVQLGGTRLDPALLPRLRPRGAADVLPVRGD